MFLQRRDALLPIRACHCLPPSIVRWSSRLSHNLGPSPARRLVGTASVVVTIQTSRDRTGRENTCFRRTTREPGPRHGRELKRLAPTLEHVLQPLVRSHFSPNIKAVGDIKVELFLLCRDEPHLMKRNVLKKRLICTGWCLMRLRGWVERTDVSIGDEDHTSSTRNNAILDLKPHQSQIH